MFDHRVLSDRVAWLSNHTSFTGFYFILFLVRVIVIFLKIYFLYTFLDVTLVLKEFEGKEEHGIGYWA